MPRVESFVIVKNQEVHLTIAVCIPCYKVTHQILNVLHDIPSCVNSIYVIDDCCPEGSGKLVEKKCHDIRVRVLYNSQNQGVGGAVTTGYHQAIMDKHQVVIKLDGDGQMNPAFIPELVAPILAKQADYTKGNRFYQIEGLNSMPRIRLIGNAGLSFINKIASGYWNIMDPTNGYTAINVEVLKQIPLEKLEKRYFFENDMLFRLNIIRAVVKDVTMHAHYGDENSNLSVSKTFFTFPGKYLKRFFKRIFYNYFLRDFNIGSIGLIFSLLFLAFGCTYGFYHWVKAISFNSGPTPNGIIMMAALPIILGYQSLLVFIQYDVNSVPKEVIGKYFS